MGLIEDLGRGPVGVDTELFIYLIEEDSRYLPVMNRCPVLQMKARVYW